MPDIYRYETVGTRTGHTFRIDITQASSAAIGGSPTVEMLPLDCIIGKCEFEWSFRDNIPYGMASALIASMAFKPSRTPSGLVDWLVDGIVPLTATIYSGAATHDVAFDCGTVFTVYIKPKDGAAFTRCAVLVQDVTQDLDYDPDRDELTINLGDALQFSLKALTFAGDDASAGLLDADWDGISNEAVGYTGVNAKTSVVDWVWKGGSNWFYVAHMPPGSEADNDAASCFWSMPVNTICSRWNEYVRAVYRKVVRNTTASVNISTALIDAFDGLYKQNYTTSPLVGSAISTGSLRWLMFATNDNDVDPATSRDYAIHDVLAEAYDNLWDFIYDMPRSRFKNWCIAHTQDGFYHSGLRHYNPFGHPYTMLDITAELRAPKIRMRADVVARVEVGTEFGLGGDYTAETAKAPTSRNDSPFDVPAIFSTCPVIDTFYLATILWPGHLQDRSQRIRDRLQNTTIASTGTVDIQAVDREPVANPRFLGVYYVENPTDGVIGDAFHFDGALIRAHAWQPFVVDGETPTPPVSTPITLSSTPGAVGGEGVAIASQQVEGVIAQLPRKIFDAYYGRNTTTITAKASMDVAAEIDLVGTESELVPFVPILRKVEVDPSTFGGLLAACPSVYYVAGCKFDLITELMELTLWGKA